jgi:hypothetical protein
MLQVFQRHVASVCSKCFICFTRMLQTFLSECCICFTYMLQEYVPNVSAISFLRCTKCFHFASISCFRGMFRESWGHGQGVGGQGAASWEPADGAHGTPRVLRMGHAHPHPGSRVPPARREEGVRGKEWQGQPRYACGAERDRRGMDMPHTQ